MLIAGCSVSGSGMGFEIGLLRSEWMGIAWDSKLEARELPRLEWGEPHPLELRARPTRTNCRKSSQRIRWMTSRSLTMVCASWEAWGYILTRSRWKHHRWRRRWRPRNRGRTRGNRGVVRPTGRRLQNAFMQLSQKRRFGKICCSEFKALSYGTQKDSIIKVTVHEKDLLRVAYWCQRRMRCGD